MILERKCNCRINIIFICALYYIGNFLTYSWIILLLISSIVKSFFRFSSLNSSMKKRSILVIMAMNLICTAVFIIFPCKWLIVNHPISLHLMYSIVVIILFLTLILLSLRLQKIFLCIFLSMRCSFWILQRLLLLMILLLTPYLKSLILIVLQNKIRIRLIIITLET